MEAMTAGSFPVHSEGSCGREVAPDGRGAIFVSATDPAEVADGVTRALTDDALVDAAGVLNMAGGGGTLRPAAESRKNPRHVRADQRRSGPGGVRMSEVTFLILPGGDPDRLGSTIESIREAAGQHPVKALTGSGLEEDLIRRAGIEPADPGSLAGGDGFVAFARAGDRLLPGTFETRFLTFVNFPEAGVSIAGHVLTGPEGQVVRRVAAPHPGSLADDILLHRSAEAAAVMVRAEALGPDHLRLLAEPFADLIVWSRIASRHGLHVLR